MNPYSFQYPLLCFCPIQNLSSLFNQNCISISNSNVNARNLSNHLSMFSIQSHQSKSTWMNQYNPTKPHSASLPNPEKNYWRSESCHGKGIWWLDHQISSLIREFTLWGHWSKDPQKDQFWSKKSSISANLSNFWPRLDVLKSSDHLINCQDSKGGSYRNSHLKNQGLWSCPTV